MAKSVKVGFDRRLLKNSPGKKSVSLLSNYVQKTFVG